MMISEKSKLQKLLFHLTWVTTKYKPNKKKNISFSETLKCALCSAEIFYENIKTQISPCEEGETAKENMGNKKNTYKII